MRPNIATLGRWLGAAALVAVSVQPALAQRTVTVRLNTATLSDTLQPSLFVPDASVIQVRGCLDGCDGDQSDLPGGDVIAWNDNTTLLPANDGGDFWSLDFQIPDNQALNFKFYSAQSEATGLGGWEDGDNHNVAAGTGDVTLDLHYFEKGDDQAYDWRPFAAEGDSVAVWLRVYMNTESAATKGYDGGDGTTALGSRGNFGTLGAVDADGPVVDWGEGGEADVGVRLTRESTDSTVPGYHLYSGLVKYPASSVGETANYKFFFTDSNNMGDGGYEDGDNRSFTVPAAGADTTIHWVYYSNSKPVGVDPPVTANTTFQVDVAPLAQAGIFQAGADQMQLRGGFNGWDCPEDNQDDCLLLRQPFSTIFSRQFPVTSVPGATAQYKFYLDFDEEYDQDIGWEEPLDNGGSNRNFVFSGNEETVGPKLYNDVRAGNVIADGRTVSVTFQVDMTRAMDFQPRAFDPAVDTVAVQFEDPVWRVTQGYEPGDPRIITNGDAALIAGFKLTDPDGDMIYTGALDITGPTYNGIAYRHTFGSEDEGLLAEGEGGFDEGRRRYRYITGAGSSFTFALDAFADPLSEKTYWEANPTGGIDPGSDQFAFDITPGQEDPRLNPIANEGGPAVEGGLSLGSAYPNPTSGIARMTVGVERDEMVIVRVYDVTGRQVGVVTEGFQTAGERTLAFDTAALASGVYVIRAEAGADAVTRRLTVTR